MSNLTPKAISRIAICAALLLAPLMTFGSAFLVYSQMDRFEIKQDAVETKATKVALSRADSEQIAAAIAMVY